MILAGIPARHFDRCQSINSWHDLCVGVEACVLNQQPSSLGCSCFSPARAHGDYWLTPSIYRNLISTRLFNLNASSAGILPRTSEPQIVFQRSNPIARVDRRTVDRTGFPKGATNWSPTRNSPGSLRFAPN